MTQIIIKKGKIYTVTGGIIENGDVLIENGKIKEIGKDLVAELDAVIINAEGKLVFPGFIEAHSHLGLNESGIGFEGRDVNEMSDPSTPHLRAIDGINPMDKTLEEAYQHGITTAATGPGSANVIGGQFAVIKTYGKRVDNMIVKESVAMKIAFGENPKRIYNSMKKSPMTRMAAAAILREELFKAKAYVEKVEAAKDDSSKKPDYDIRMEALAKVIRKEIHLKAHAHRADDILTAVRIAKEFDVNMTIDHCSEGHFIVDELAEENFPVIIGPTLGHRSKFETKNKTFKTPGILNKSGLKVAITTDSPVVPIHYLPLCAGNAMKSGMDEMEAIKAITINAAEILGIEDKVGSLEVGKDADIVIYDGHPLKDVTYETLYTIIDGKIAHKKED